MPRRENAGPIVYDVRRDLTESARTATTATLHLSVIPLAQDRPCHPTVCMVDWPQVASRDPFKSWTNAVPFLRTNALRETCYHAPGMPSQGCMVDWPA